MSWATSLALATSPDPGCLVQFSNSIEDTDRKDWRYCNWCDGSSKGISRQSPR